MTLVSLVGAGPGDPGLITVRGRERLQSCDCVVYDYLVNPVLLDLVPVDAARHYVGKKGLKSSTPQEEINRLLVEVAAKHQRIVRLKGGDPFLFGRGGEECQALAAAGITFEIVPGVTSGIGAPAYAGIPVTHRASASAVVFVTGHQQDDAVRPFDWSAIAQVETIVLYMGMHRLAENLAALVRAGRPATTPAAAIQWGTYPHQRVVTGTLADLAENTAAVKLGAPAITVIGEVVAWREHLRWFDHPLTRPLAGKRVLVTRAREQASDLSALLRDRGAAVQEIPLARFVAPADTTALDHALGQLDHYGWIAFTSANGVEFAFARLAALGLDARAIRCRVAAVGPATARVLRERGIAPDLLPAVADAEHLAEALIAHAGPPPTAEISVRGLDTTLLRSRATSALLPQADNARSTLRDRLRSAGWRVDALTAYTAEPLRPAIDPDQLEPDAITFASSATVERFLAFAGEQRLRRWIAAGCRLYAIGPTTAAGLTSRHLPVAAVADDASIPGLVAALERDLRPGSAQPIR